MTLTFDECGKLAVFNTGSYTQLEIDSLHSLYDVMHDYDVDFISPTLTTPHLHTDDKNLISVVKAFQLVRLQAMMAMKLFREVPQA